MLPRRLLNQRAQIARRRHIGPGSFIAAGDQALFNERSTTWDGLEEAPWFGNRYDPEGDTWTNGDAWLTLEPSRLAASGAFYLEEQAASATLHAILRGGTNTARLRAIAYGQGATANNLTSVDYITDGALPAARGAYSTAELTVAGGSTLDEYSAALNAGLAPGNHFLGFWSDTAATGAQVWYLENGVAGRCRTSSGDSAAAYSSTNPPPATWPTTQTAPKHEWAVWCVYTPVAPTAPTLQSAVALGNRAIRLSWTNTDSRTTRVRIERRKGGGAWVYAAVVEGVTTYDDPDLQAGALYEYRLVACHKNAPSAPSAVLGNVAGGVRLATASTVFAQLAGTVSVPNTGSGLQGGQSSIAGVVQHERYKRTTFDWSALEPTEGNYTFGVIETFLNGLAANERGHIRIRTTVPDTSNTLPAYIKATGNWAIADGGEHPDYRNAYVRGRAVALAAALGAAFNNDPRLAYVDMGFVGPYGEYGGPTAYVYTASDLIPIIDAVTSAFSNKLIYMTVAIAVYGGEELVTYALDKPNVIGLRFDSLGDSANPSGLQRASGQRSAANRLRIRDPRFSLLAELKSSWSVGIATRDVTRLGVGVFGAENLSGYGALSSANQALMQAAWRAAGYRLTLVEGDLPSHLVRGQGHAALLAWRNLGNRAPIEGRPVEYQLRSGGAVVAGCRWTSAVDIRNVLPSLGGTDYTDLITVPLSVAPGTYQLCLEGPAYAGGRVPALELATNLTRSGGAYVLRTVEVL